MLLIRRVTLTLERRFRVRRRFGAATGAATRRATRRRRFTAGRATRRATDFRRRFTPTFRRRFFGALEKNASLLTLRLRIYITSSPI